ncbi:MAG: hypothetical protein ACLT4C_07065 [Butyricicoccus sp.]
MLVYITFRFELTSGLAAICCLVHDLLVMLSVYVLAADSARQQLHCCCTDHPRLLHQRVHHRIRPRS